MPLLPDFVTPLPEHIVEFQALYRKHFGVSLSNEEARQQLEHLLVIVAYRKRLIGSVFPAAPKSEGYNL